MKPFSTTALQIPRSGIREIMALASEKEGVIHLEVGQPDFPTAFLEESLVIIAWFLFNW